LNTLFIPSQADYYVMHYITVFTSFSLIPISNEEIIPQIALSQWPLHYPKEVTKPIAFLYHYTTI